MKKNIQYQWDKGFLPGIDCIVFGDGTVIIGNCYLITKSETDRIKKHWYWFPLCDTTISSLEKYEPDIWTAITIHPQ